MNRIVTEELYRIPDLHRRLELAAHRARSEAIRAGFATARAALARFARRLAPRFDFHPRHWMERLG